MKKIYKKLESVNKIILLLCVLLIPTESVAEFNSKKWVKECDKEKKNCIAGIISEISVSDSDKKQTLSTAYIVIGSSTKKKMDLIDGDEQTYKLKEVNQFVPVLFINLPFNSDLKKKPLVQINEESILNLEFTHCNQTVGCSTNIALSDAIIKRFKDGKSLDITFGAYRSKNVKISFPLKGFTKSYDGLLK